MSIATEDNPSRFNNGTNISQRINEITGKINQLEPNQKEDANIVFLEKIQKLDG